MAREFQQKLYKPDGKAIEYRSSYSTETRISALVSGFLRKKKQNKTKQKEFKLTCFTLVQVEEQNGDLALYIVPLCLTTTQQSLVISGVSLSLQQLPNSLID